jgi:hypothetical protein
LLGFSRYFKSLIDVYGYSKSLADVVRYFILVDFSRFLKFWFGV